MLDKAQLIDLFDRLGTPEKGRRLVIDSRIKAPVREVASRGGNVLAFLASRKMGRQIRTESLHNEFAAAYLHEFDEKVIEYYAQPCLLSLELFDQAAQDLKSVQHFPDFLVIRDDGITLEEWKSEVKLQRLAERYPYRYSKLSDGAWTSPQIEKQVADLGLRYRIRSSDDISRKRVENLQHLADYLHPATAPCPPEVLVRLRAALEQHGVLTLHELFNEPFNFKADDVLKAVADHEVVADLDRETLSQVRSCRIYRDATLRDFMAADVRARGILGEDRFVIDLRVGARFIYGEQELSITLLAENEVTFNVGNGQTTTMSRDWLVDAIEQGRVKPSSTEEPISLDLARYSEQDLQTALHRQAIINSDSEVQVVSNRSTRRWLARQKAALAVGGNEVIALVPKTNRRGNRTPRLTEAQQDILLSVIKNHWGTPAAPNFTACHHLLRVACADAGVKAPSYPTLVEHVKALQSDQLLRERHGKRMTYQQAEFVDVLHEDTPVHGSRPFQYVHIDHTQADIELISSRTGKSLGRPWLTLAVDAWSRRVLAIYLTFDPPSYHSVMMAMRDMVRRFGRLPEHIITDNGRDFISSAFEAFLQLMGVHLRLRPAGRPRHGSVMERMFGTANTQYIHNLAGNTKATKNVRMITGKHLPKRLAEWTLESLYYGIDHWATDFYDQSVHPALGCSPREAFVRGLREHGARAHRKILLNQDFLIATCPPVDREGLRKINRQTGVKVNDLYYWHPDLRSPRFAGQKSPVRYDPWDCSSVYVWLKDHWVQARCRALAGLGQMTEFERASLTEEYRARHSIGNNPAQEIQRLREFLRTFTPEGALAVALERQQENMDLYRGIGISSITPVSPAPSSKTAVLYELGNGSSSSEPIFSVDGLNHISSQPASPTIVFDTNNLPDYGTF